MEKNTTRADIAADLCQGGTTESDRAGRALVCNGILATQNLAYQVTDGDNRLIINVGPNVGNSTPRVDDPTNRLLSTSGAAAGQPNPAGAFLVGSTLNATTTPPTVAPGNRIQVRFEENGRYLVICQNRGHSLNDHMFGFVNVVDVQQ